MGLAAPIAAVALWTAGIAAGAVGELTYQGCMTGEAESGPAGSGACEAIASATPGGLGSGSDFLNSIALSPDGASLYAASAGDAAVVAFDRDPTTGALDYQGCITGETESGPAGSGACEAIPSAASGGVGSGLLLLDAVVVSADGTSLYAAANGDDAVARFKRDPATGDLTYKGCITGDTHSGPTGSGACEEILSATPDGTHSGLDFLTSIALSPDGASLYAASSSDDAVARLERNTTTGAITYKGCLTGNREVGPTGSGACAEIPSAGPFGIGSGLDRVEAIVSSPDGSSLYTASFHDAAVARFDRNTTSGALTFAGCVSGATQTGPGGSGACDLIPRATPFGFDSGLWAVNAVSLSADGTSLYATSGDDAVARFNRNTTDGALTYKGCLTGETQSGPDGSGACTAIPSASAGGPTAGGGDSGLDSLSSVALSADGESLYTVSQDDDAVARFKRHPDSGRLSYEGCITGERRSGPKRSGACAKIGSATPQGQDSGLDFLKGLAVSADGKSLYTASQGDDAVARLDRAIPRPP